MSAPKPNSVTTSKNNIVRRDSRNDARYSGFGMGVAMRRLSSFFLRASTIAKPMPQMPLPIKFMPNRPGMTKSM